jgi:hypothetical protein
MQINEGRILIYQIILAWKARPRANLPGAGSLLLQFDFADADAAVKAMPCK